MTISIWKPRTFSPPSYVGSMKRNGMGETRSPCGERGLRREFLHVDDLADACLMLIDTYDSPETINVGWGDDLPIKDLAETVAAVVGFEGEIQWDTSKPDGMPRKLLDTSRINALGWHPTIKLRDGVASTYEWYVDQNESA